MSAEQCWSLQFNGTRCEAPAAPPAHFCAAHGQRGGGANPLSIWRAPEDEMPPDLVAILRRAVPGVTFPPRQPSPPSPDRCAPAALRKSIPPASPPLPEAGSAPSGEAVPSLPPAASDHTSGAGLPPCLRIPSDGIDWLLALLQEAMTGVMAGEATPLQKANAVARLAALYLKAARAAELEQANAALAERAAAAEAYAADLEARATAWAALLQAGESEPDPADAVPFATAQLPERAYADASLPAGPLPLAPEAAGPASSATGLRSESVRSGDRAPP